jgi:hypothetical protein
MRTYFCLIAAAAALCTLLVPGTAAAQLEPSITASLTGEGVWGGGFDPETPVAVHVQAADGTVKTVYSNTDGDGYFEADPGMQLLPGMQVVVESGRWTRELALAQLAFDLLDPGHDIATGTAPAGTAVRVETWPSTGGVNLTTTALAGDTWRADFGAQHLQVGGNAAALVSEPDGDTTWASRRAPSLTANFHYEFQRVDVGVGGDGWTPGARVDLEILDPEGAVLWTGSVVASAGEPGNEEDSGAFGVCCTREAWGLGFDLAPGMQIRATDSATDAFKELVLARFTVDRVDPAAGEVSGTAPGDAEVWVNVDGTGHETVANPDGTWRVAAPETGWSSWVEAGTGDLDDDTTGASAQPATISASLTRDRIDGTYFSLGGDVRVEVLAGGTPAWSTTVSTGDTRAISLEAGVDLVPGMTVRVTDLATGLQKAVELVPLSVDVVDPVADRAAGTGSSGRLFAWQPGIGGGEIGEVVPGGDGTWSFVFPSWFDVTPATLVSVFVPDDEADRTWAEYVPPVVAIPALEESVAASVPAELAKPLEEKLEGALARLGGTGGVAAAATATTSATGTGGTVNVGAAINKLGAFANQVDGLVRAHRLAPETGARLAAEARRILVGLGG